MVAMMYTVTAERGKGPVWVFQCIEHPGAISESRRLSAAAELMAEAIGFVAGVDPSSVEIDLAVVLSPEAHQRVARVRAMIEQLEALQRETAAMSRSTVRELIDDEHLTGADTAYVLGVSPQRVSQLVNS
jgi:hypothetical protein